MSRRLPLLLPAAFALACCVLLAALPASAQRQVVAPVKAVLDLPFSPAVWNGDVLMLSGAIGNRPGTTEVEGDAAQQSQTTFDNLKTVLTAADMDFSHVVDLNVYLADARHLPQFTSVYRQTMVAPRPAMTVVQADIAIPAALTEVSMIAVRPGVSKRSIVPEGWPERDDAAWAWLVGDETLWISGMGPIDPATGRFVPGERGDTGAQVRRTMDNIGQILAAAKMDHDDLVSCRIYLRDARTFSALNEVYPTFFKAAPPARATVRAQLMDPEQAVEIQCTAAKGERKAVLPEGASPRKTLSPAIQVGSRLFLSGMVGRQADGTFPTDVGEQTQVVLDNLEATLKAAGLTFDDVTDATVYLTDIRHYTQMNAVYGPALNKPAPARATVGTVLMSPDALVEIQMQARRTGGQEP